MDWTDVAEWILSALGALLGGTALGLTLALPRRLGRLVPWLRTAGRHRPRGLRARLLRRREPDPGLDAEMIAAVRKINGRLIGRASG